jgi:hypothetical protein
MTESIEKWRTKMKRRNGSVSDSSSIPYCAVYRDATLDEIFDDGVYVRVFDFCEDEALIFRPDNATRMCLVANGLPDHVGLLYAYLEYAGNGDFSMRQLIAAVPTAELSRA